MIERDIETGNVLMPVYIALTCSKANYDKTPYDFDSNSIASRVNVETFKEGWQEIFWNKNIGLEDKIKIPESDSEFFPRVFFAWAVAKKSLSPNGEHIFLDEPLSKTYLGIITEKFLKDNLPKTAEDLSKQFYHFRLDKLPQF